MLQKALSDGGEIISRMTKKAWVERVLPEEPPAFILPDKLKVGDNVQVLNWVPMGVHGAKVDLFPRGNVSKMYFQKCVVTKESYSLDQVPSENIDLIEEERLYGLELDGEGIYITKDSSIIIRYPAAGTPSGQTSHVNPGVM